MKTKQKMLMLTWCWYDPKPEWVEHKKMHEHLKKGYEARETSKATLGGKNFKRQPFFVIKRPADAAN